MVRGEIALEIVDQLRQLGECGAVTAAGHQDPLRAEQLRNLAEDGRTAAGGYRVTDAADQRIRGEAGEGIRAAAFKADDQIPKVTPGTLVRAHFVHQRLKRRKSRLNFVADRLGVKVRQPILAAGPQLRDQRSELIALASKPHHQYGPGVGVSGKRGQYLAGAIQIIAQLRAAKGMTKGKYPIGATGELTLRLLSDATCGLGHAPNRAQDPHFVAYADLPVRTSITHETPLRMRRRGPRGRFAVRVLIV